MVLGPSGGWSTWPLTGPLIKGGVGHLPSGLGVGKLWGFFFLSFSEGKGEKKTWSEESRFGLVFLETLSNGLAPWNLLHKRSWEMALVIGTLLLLR